MSKCIIQIKIGDQVITLDPNADISPASADYLINTLDINKLRVLYSNIKDAGDASTNFSSRTAIDPGLANQGSAIYTAIVDKATKEGEWISPMAALSTGAVNNTERSAIAAFIASLPSDEILTHGNYLLDMQDAYKLSPYSQEDIRNLIFGGSSKLQLDLYNRLINVPGLETLRISVAIADELRPGSPIYKPKGVYLRPDNIIQVLIPTDAKYYAYGVSDESGINKANLTREALKEAKNMIIHELTHAVFSELYISDPTFRNNIKQLHTRFTEHLDTLNKSGDEALRNVYSDVHEFLADMFVNRKLQGELSNFVSKDHVYESLGRTDMYKFLVGSLSPKNQDLGSSLQDALAIMTDSIPTLAINDSFEKQALDYVDITDKRSLFFMNPGVTPERIDQEMAPNDMYDSYWSVNAKAYRMQKAYLDRVTIDPKSGKASLKDAHYKENVDRPTQAQLDRLYAEDLVLIPWVRYDRIEGEKGSWIEQGVLTRKGKEVMEDGKLKVVDITRNKSGNIVQPDNGDIIEERHRHVPVMYSNHSKNKVVVAKVGLDPDTQKASYDGYNTISIPYELIRGIRKYNWDYFDHTHDYEADLKEAEKNYLASNNYKNGVESKFDRTAVYKRQIERLLGVEAKGDLPAKEGLIDKAARIKQELVDLHRQYAFNYSVKVSEDEKEYHKSITKEDYLKLGYSDANMGSTTFAEPDDATFIAKPIGNGKFIPDPNPKKFQQFWQGDSGKDFAKASATVAEAVTKGDLIRISRTEKTEDGTTINKSDWLPVYQKVANGVLVGTPNGKGLIVNFNNIDAYAKNTTTSTWASLLLKQKDVIDSFVDDMYLPKEEDEKRAKTNTERVGFVSLQYNEDYWAKDDDASEEEGLTRFNKYVNEKVMPMVIPNESFVKVRRRYVDMEKKTETYQSLELVLAKTDKSVITLRLTSTGNFKIDHINLDDTIEEGANWGKELVYLVEDTSAAHQLWKDYLAEKAMFKENEDKDPWLNEGTDKNPVWKKVLDVKTDPRSVRDIYDFYDNPNGKTISRLTKGDIVAIKVKGEDVKIPHYFRKVLRVLDDGRIAVVENRKEAFKYKDGGVGKKGLYVRYITLNDISKVGYRMGKVEKDGDNFVAEFHQDLIDRRLKLMAYAEKDLDTKDFEFRTAATAMKFNAKIKDTSALHKRYTPFTSKILDPKSEEDAVFLNRDGEEVNESDAAWVEAWFDGDTFKNAPHGLAANSTFFKSELIVDNTGKYPKLKTSVLEALMPGDWVVTSYKNKKGELRQWSNLVDRVEGNKVYTINSDISTSTINFKKLVGIRTSKRNDMYSPNFEKWKRPDALYKLLVKEESTPKTPRKSKKNTPKASLDMAYKSPADSRRALFEIGNRLQTLNPDIKLNYVEQAEVNDILKGTGFDYSGVRAFVMNGEVFINLEKASISDVVHEYSHLFLHTLKYDQPKLYDTIVEKAKESPAYDKIAREYGHLTQESDINEEVFVTLLGEYMKGSLDAKSTAKMEANKDVVVSFSEYTKEKLDTLFSGKKGYSSNIDPIKILNMRLEDVIALVGDNVMNNRINNFEEPPALEQGRDIEALVKDLKKRGLLTEECYG